MKKMLILPAVLVLFSCNSQKKAVAYKEAKVQNESCPADGTCKVTLEKDKALDIKKDEFGSTYYHLIDAPGKNVVKYEYTRHIADTTLADAGYREEVAFEVDSANPNMELTGFTLENGKVLFGRFCFCRGATGYYRVRDGNLLVKQEDAKLNIKMNFKITEVPQIIKNFEIVIQ
jgi:hypothetical protein